MARGRSGMVKLLSSLVFLFSIFSESNGNISVKRLVDRNVRQKFSLGIPVMEAMPFSNKSTSNRQAITEPCGLTGDGLTDPFGLAGQFQTGKRKRRDADEDEESFVQLNVEGRSFKMERRKSKVKNAPSTPAKMFGQKIVGGQDTTPTSLCWQVLIVATLPSGQEQICGGAIIGSRSILTTAQCLLDFNTRLPLTASNFQIIVGALNSGAPATNSQDPTGCAQTFTASAITGNPNYFDPTSDNDVAVITLSTAININQKPCACLLCLKSRVPATGEKCVVAGYGDEVDPSTGTGPRNPVPLKWVAQTVLSQVANISLCPVFQDSSTGALTNTDDFYCTAGPVGQDACIGDQGGALVCYDPTTSSHYAAGLISFGSVVCGAGNGGQNTKLVNYLSWILQAALPGDVVISDGSVTAPPTTVSTTTQSTPTTAFVTVTPPPGAKLCGLPGNNAADPFGIVSQFSQGKSNRRRLTDGKDVALTRVQRMKFRPAARIIGGFDAPETEICWQAFVLAALPDGLSMITCGGIIIGPRTILTTASCVLDLSGVPIVASAITVNVGALDSNAPATNANDPLGCAQEFQVVTSAMHEQYVFATNDNDIAVLTLATAIDIQSKPCACTLCLTTRIPAVNELCVMSGYGFETSDMTMTRDPIPLKWVQQTIHQQNTSPNGGFCAVFQDPVTLAVTNVTNFICSNGALGQDQCLGDNGGSLACYNPTTKSYYAAGIISISTATCGNGQGGQSVKIFNYLQWIADHSLAGDVTFPGGIVTQPTVGTTTQSTTSLSTPSSTSGGTSTGSTVTTTSSTTSLSSSSTTTGSSTIGCGRPGNGQIDPFNLLSQFTAVGLLKAKNPGRVTFFDGQRIIGGTPAQAKEICWQALVLADLPFNQQQSCGGSIIGSRTIVTAGHCVISALDNSLLTPSAMSVVVGSTFYPAESDTSGCAKTLSVREIILHPDFNLDAVDSDIALLVLNSPVDLVNSGGCYCSICVTDEQPLAGESCVVSGYGQQTMNNSIPLPDVIPLSWVKQKIRVQSYDGSCQAVIDSSTGATADLDQFVCAGGQFGEDSCYGDSGGPLFCMNPASSRHYLVGLTSFGADICGTTVGSQYTKVAHFLDFISQNAPAGDVTIEITGQITTTIGTMQPPGTTTPTSNGPTNGYYVSPGMTTTSTTSTTTSQATSSYTAASQYFPGFNNRRFHGPFFGG